MPIISFKVVSVNIAEKKGVQKVPVDYITLVENHGIQGDAHAGPWHRQVSFLAMEDIKTMRDKGLDVSSGDFAENITTRGIDWPSVPVGTQFQLGEARLEMTQIGKECHNRCAIYHAAGDCVMPRQGVFAKVLKGGMIDNQSIGSVHIG